MEKGRGLVELCIEAATASGESVEKWRRQRRTLERLPSHLADAVFCRLLRHRLLFPSILEIFLHCVEMVDLRGESSVDAEWMAYLGAFRYLRSLNVADCKSINNAALWHLSGLNSLKELNLSRCSKITDAGIKHLLSLASLDKLCVSETGLSADGVMLLSSLINVRVLDLGGIPVTDKALSSLQVLTHLEHLDLWGSEISNSGVAILGMFPMLTFLNLAWTNVTRLPNLSSISCLNMSNCTIHSILDGDLRATALSKIIVTGATFVDTDKVFSSIQAGCLKFLDISYCSNIVSFDFLVNMKGLEHLDLRYSQITDGLMEQVVSVGENLKYLNLTNTKISSHALSILAGCVPNLKYLYLSHTSADDTSIAYISMIPSLRVIDLSHTRIRGFIDSGRQRKSDKMLSLTALWNLTHLRSLNLEDTKLIDEALPPLSLLSELECLYLKSDFFTDFSLHALASLLKLRCLGLRGAVLTDYGLLSFRPPPLLRVLDIRGCWLLSPHSISSFCTEYQQIEVKHEHVNNSFVDQDVFYGSSPYLATTKAHISRPKTAKSWKTSRSSFVDERIRYTTEELLELEHSAGSSLTLKDLDLMPEILRKTYECCSAETGSVWIERLNRST